MIVIMVNSFHDVDGLAGSPLYRQVSVATGSRHVAIAGQVATSATGKVVGPGDLAAQTEQCYLNVATALASVGATFDDVTRLTVYFTDWSDELAAEFVDRVAASGCATRVEHVVEGAAHRGRGGGAGRARVHDRGRGERGPRLTGEPAPARTLLG